MKPNDFQHLLFRLALNGDDSLEITYRDDRKFEGYIADVIRGDNTAINFSLKKVKKNGDNPVINLDFDQIVKVVLFKDRGEPEVFE